jgi:hypothetical protein
MYLFLNAPRARGNSLESKIGASCVITEGLSDQLKSLPAGGYRKIKPIDALRYIYVKRKGPIPSSRLL